MTPTSSSRSLTYVAVFDDNAMDEPLLPKDNVNDIEEDAGSRNNETTSSSWLFRRFQRSSLVLGLLMGFLIQFSTLGANSLAAVIWGKDVVLHSSARMDVLVFSTAWSVVTSVMAVIMLAVIRNLVSMTHRAFANDDNNTASTLTINIDDWLMQLECRYVVGALVGVCLAWSWTDLLLGQTLQMIYSSLILVGALVWCRLMVVLNSSSSTTSTSSSKSSSNTNGREEHLLV